MIFRVARAILAQIAWHTFSSIILSATALAASVIIDDTSTSISYSSGWAAQPGGCNACSWTSPDPSQIQSGTWHFITVPLEGSEAYFEFSFRGTSVTIYAFIGPSFVYADGTSVAKLDATLMVDGTKADGYSDALYDGAEFAYQRQMLVKESLQDAEHMVRVLVAPGSVMAFDYVEFVNPSLPSTTTSPSSSASISTSSASISTSSTSNRGDGTSESNSATVTILPSNGGSSVPIVSSAPSETPILPTSTGTGTAGSQQSGTSPIGSQPSPEDRNLSTQSMPIPAVSIVGIVLGATGLLLLFAILLVLFIDSRRTRVPYSWFDRPRNPYRIPNLASPMSSTFPRDDGADYYQQEMGSTFPHHERGEEEPLIYNPERSRLPLPSSVLQQSLQQQPEQEPGSARGVTSPLLLNSSFRSTSTPGHERASSLASGNAVVAGLKALDAAAAAATLRRGIAAGTGTKTGNMVGVQRGSSRLSGIDEDVSTSQNPGHVPLVPMTSAGKGLGRLSRPDTGHIQFGPRPPPATGYPNR